MVPFLTGICLICSEKESPGTEGIESMWSSLEINFGFIVFLLSNSVFLLQLKLISLLFQVDVENSV